MKGLREKFRKNEGFTLVEMLIVVAIIAILVAVSIPLVNTSLEKARQATDDANLRAAKAEATIMYMNDQMGVTTESIKDNYWYDNVAGTFVETLPSTNKGYNQSTTVNGITGSTERNSAAVQVAIDASNSTAPITVKWAKVNP
ncbi:MAG: type II secretion system protein [Lawsonibacter sp.]|nr:type II secretion system protein [Lawsonibacter sp.]